MKARVRTIMAPSCRARIVPGHDRDAEVAPNRDLAGRQLTETDVVRQPEPAAYTTKHTYETTDPHQPCCVPWKETVTTPGGVTSTTVYDVAGEPISVTDGSGNTTTYQYDAAGRRIRIVLPDQTSQTATYDLAGRAVATALFDASGNKVSGTSSAYDKNGRKIAQTDARGHTTTFGYDALGRLARQVEPATDTTSITTSFGYDAAGNRTRFTDGHGNTFGTTYNSWNLPESQIEPATSTYQSPADRTFTTAYDAAGRPVTRTAPGGVTVTNTFDDVGNLVQQDGSGADALTATRTFGYDKDGRITSASAPGGTDRFTYDDRGQLLSATGPSGSSSFTYAPDGQLASRIDAAGTSTYGYDNAGRLNRLADAATGAQLTYTYNPLSQVQRIVYGDNGDTRTFGYDAAHRLTSDVLASNTGVTIASITYGYDGNDNETSKVTTGLAGPASNTYTYDYANRLTSWNNGTTTTTYGYDASGNRTSVGGKTYTYDARNQLVSGDGSTYRYTARGTLSSVTTGSAVTATTSDAFGQVITRGTRMYEYDALSRVVNAKATGEQTRTMSYSGMGNLLASDGTGIYSRSPSGDVVGEKVGDTAVLAWSDLHSDVVGQFTAAGTALAGSRAYDPLGNPLDSQGVVGNLGYQSGWTDPADGKVNMAARWYDPTVGQFTSRDTVDLDPTPNSVDADRFAYADDNPLTGTDPTGHCSLMSWSCWKKGGSAVLNTAKKAASATWNTLSSAASQAWDTVTTWASDAWHGFTNWASDTWSATKKEAKQTYNQAVRITKNVINDGKRAASTFVHTVKDTTVWLEKKAERAANVVSHAAAKAWDATTSGVSVAADWVESHQKQIAAAVAGFAVGAVTFAGCEFVTGGVGSVGCVALAGAAGGAVAGLIGCPEGVSKLACAGIGAASGLVAVGVGALVAAGASALGAGAILGGVAAGGAAGAAGDITGQLLSTGHVDWSEVGVSTLVGGAMGGIGGAAGAMRGGGARGPAAAEATEARGWSGNRATPQITRDQMSGSAMRIARSLDRTGTVKLGRGVPVQSLAQASQYLDREIGVIQNTRTGRMRAFVGDDSRIQFRAGPDERLIAHTHPTFQTNPGDYTSDLHAPGVTSDLEVGIDWSGNVTHFHKGEIVENPENPLVNEYGYLVGERQ
jgi:large repetitive protein